MTLIRFALALLVFPAAALAQRTTFLHPESAQIAPGAPLRVRLEAAAKPVPWDAAAWIMVRAGDAQENMDTPPNAPDAAGLITLPSPGAGPAIVAVDLRPATEEIDAAALRAFTRAKCAQPLPPEVAGKVRLRRIESCKALLRIGDAPGATAMSKCSLAAEIQPRIDPTRASPGSDIAFIAAIEGGGVEGVRILVTSPDGKVQDSRAVASGVGHLHITVPGPWRIEFHRLTKATPEDAADWVLTTSTLTFTVPGAKP